MMTSLHRILLVFSVLLLSGCGLFSTDVTPAAAGVEARQELFDQVADGYAVAIESITDPEKKARAQAALAEIRAQYDLLGDEILKYLEEVGSLDIEELAVATRRILEATR